jgi:predicted nucleic acid-binding Zn ribbon protein
MILTIEKTCRECGSSIRGRQDKKFCSDQCRSNHHYRTRNADTPHIRQINAILRKNWRILAELFSETQGPVSGRVLRLRGFDFHYYTNCVARKDGTYYYYCYDKGYTEVGENLYRVVTE